MSHGEIRTDKNCENCNTFVSERFCSHCGQENIETRQPFYFLITHFIEDLVHYDSSFWQTIKKLFLNPGALTLEYLSGKRQSSVNPVKMYIFVSFMAFLTLAIFPSRSKPQEKNADIDLELKMTGANDSIGELTVKEEKELLEGSFGHLVLKPIYEKSREINKKNISNEELGDKLYHNFLSLIPKALFLYMPFFAFLLWLIYDKKKWWFFDHGIFTLHYFSMLLLVTTIISVLNNTIGLVNNTFFSFLLGVIKFFLICYTTIYFYLALHKIYKQRKLKTILKGTFLIWVNGFFIALLIAALFIYSFLKL